MYTRGTPKRLLLLFTLITLLLSSCLQQPITSDSDSSKYYADPNTLEVHFLDVGQADSILLLCGDESMLVDGGNKADSRKVAAYLTNHGVTHIDYMICTHAHEDHVGGLSGALNVCTVGTVYSPVTEYDSEAFRDFLKYLDAQELTPTVPNPGDRFELGESTVTVLAPLASYENTNDTSIVLRVEYGETVFLLTGDAEYDSEHDMLDAEYDLGATVLKVGHHGSESSTSYSFLRDVMPEYAVISVGKDNSYGHPHEETLSRLRDAGTVVYRTDEQGDIVCISDGKEVSFTFTGDEPKAENSEIQYIGNIKSEVFHRSDCNSLPSEKNRVYFADRDEAIAEGYSPCGFCRP